MSHFPSIVSGDPLVLSHLGSTPTSPTGEALVPTKAALEMRRKLLPESILQVEKSHLDSILQITVSSKMELLCDSICIISGFPFILLPYSPDAIWMPPLIYDKSIKKPLKSGFSQRHLWRLLGLPSAEPLHSAWTQHSSPCPCEAPPPELGNEAPQPLGGRQLAGRIRSYFLNHLKKVQFLLFG